MEGIKGGKRNFLIAIFFLVFFIFSATAQHANAQELIILSSGDSKQISFYLSDIINPSNLHRSQGFIVVTVGDAEELNIALTTSAQSSDPLFALDYILLGLAYGSTAGPQLVIERATTPLVLTKSIEVNAPFGIYALAAAATGYESPGDFDFPAVFTIAFGLDVPVQPVTGGDDTGADTGDDHADDDH